MKHLPSALLLFSLSPLMACQAPSHPTPLAPVQAQALSQSARADQARFYDTAKDAYRWAQLDAQRWDFSARLAQVEARSVDEQGRSFEWTFYFTSYRKDKALRVTSNHDVEEVNDHFFGGGIMDLSWQINSDQALNAAKNQGLKSFPVQSMKLDDFLVWEIDSFDGYFQVDARTGAVTQR